jgi:hypothetical protein
VGGLEAENGETIEAVLAALRGTFRAGRGFDNATIWRAMQE